MDQTNNAERLWRRPIGWAVTTLLAAIFGTLAIGVFNGAGYDVQKYGEQIGRKISAQPKVATLKAMARALKEKTACERELQNSIALEQENVRSAQRALQDCRADVRHWLLAQSCELNERLVIAAEARLSVLKEPNGC